MDKERKCKLTNRSCITSLGKVEPRPPLLEPDLEGKLTGEHLVVGPLAIDLSQAESESTAWDGD